MPWVGLRCVIVVFPDHTRLLFDQILLAFTIQNYLATGMQNGEEPFCHSTTPTISSGTALTDTDCSSIYSPNLQTVCLKSKQYWVATGVYCYRCMRTSVRRSVHPWSVSENAHNSWKTWYIFSLNFYFVFV